MMTHLGVEFTNHCNLACPNCPNAYTTVPKGYMSQETLELAIEHGKQKQIFQLHGLGEPLLHPEALRFARIVCESDKDFYSSMSTNGLLLTPETLDELLDMGLQELFISLHVPKSVDALIMTAKRLTTYTGNIRVVATNFIGNDKTNEYLSGIKDYDIVQPYLEAPTKYFTWSGTVKGTQLEFPPDVVASRIKRCWFIVENICAIIRWDGTVNACCYDHNNINYLGHISNFPSLCHTPATYELCKYCEPKMANQFH